MFAKTVLVFSVLVSLSLLWGTSYSFAADREKAEEGRYAVLHKGGLVQGTEHSWTLWRLPGGGYELEDHFQIDQTEAAMLALLGSPRVPVSPGLRDAVKNRVSPTDLSAVYSPEGQLLSLRVRGKKANGANAEGLICKASSTSIECAGTEEKTKLHLHEACGLLWWYGVPMLLRPWLPSKPPGSASSEPKTAAVLSFGLGPKPRVEIPPGMGRKAAHNSSWGDRPALEPADLTVSRMGPAVLVLGDRSFRTTRYTLGSKTEKAEPISLTLWTDDQGAILAVEDAGNPGDLITLVEYKKYSTPVPPAPSVAPK
jgi:hypothetical protein